MSPELFVMGQHRVTPQELRTYIKVQYEEIDKYRWTESEKKGEDIGRQVAQAEWVSRYARKFREYWEIDRPIVFLICTKQEKTDEHGKNDVETCLKCPYCHYVIKGKPLEGKIIVEDVEHNGDAITKPQWCELPDETKKD